MSLRHSRPIVWWSDPGSITHDRISVLAVTETILASGLALYFYTNVGSLYYLATVAALSPLTLLRTRRSDALALYLLLRFPYFFGTLTQKEFESRIRSAIERSKSRAPAKQSLVAPLFYFLAYLTWAVTIPLTIILCAIV